MNLFKADMPQPVNSPAEHRVFFIFCYDQVTYKFLREPRLCADRIKTPRGFANLMGIQRAYHAQ
ncbi:hypothetical protein SDC9_154083 [bioreactor metagenome]|uniref:Uncharacterized protein n=1 Tax=bioreactor metagenome TaxID=1076179 RepID=A0A645EZG9_9ZZZZ